MSSPFGRRGRNARSVRFDLLKIMMKKPLGFLNEEREFVGGQTPFRYISATTKTAEHPCWLAFRGFDYDCGRSVAQHCALER